MTKITSRRMSDDPARWARLHSRTFRWSSGEDTTGYAAAEVVPGRVVWLSWSHIQGEGRRELGAQTLAELRVHGPTVSVPPRVLAEILAALQPG